MCANRQQGGDPEGRRLARRRALLLAEAGKVARLLEILLRRAGYNTDSYEELVRDLAGHENSQLVKSYGRLESRKRYKGQSSQPLLDERNINALYVDENGKSKPEPQTGPTFFTLGAISMMPDDTVIYRESADKLKGEFFGRTDITFHEPYMSNHDGLYYFNGDQDKQSEFDDAIRKLIQATPFVGFGVGVRKDAYAEFMVEEPDPYLPTDVYSLAIDLLLERYVDYLATRGEKVMGRVTFESQGPKEDAEHQMEYARLLLEGTQWVPASAFRNWLETGMRFTPKSNSDPMELADMFSRSLYEWVRDGCHVAPSKWDVFETKMYCREDGLRGKFGIKIFPDTDIRDRIEEHRHHVAQRRETKSAHLRESERR